MRRQYVIYIEVINVAWPRQKVAILVKRYLFLVWTVPLMKSIGIANVIYGVFVFLSYFDFKPTNFEDYMIGLMTSIDLLMSLSGITFIILGIAIFLKSIFFLYFCCGLSVAILISIIILQVFAFGALGTGIALYTFFTTMVLIATLCSIFSIKNTK